MDTTLRGKRVRMIEDMVDPQPILANEEGTINYTDDMGQIQVKWDNGRSLALIPNVDKFIVLD